MAPSHLSFRLCLAQHTPSPPSPFPSPSPLASRFLATVTALFFHHRRPFLQPPRVSLSRFAQPQATPLPTVMSFRDDSPKMPDGTKFNGKQLMELVRKGQSPFRPAWDVQQLFDEVERVLSARVVDVPFVSNGSNNYGFHLHLEESNGAAKHVMARLARGDVNMPDYDGFELETQVPEVQFEAAVYRLLESEPAILASHILHHRIPVEHPGPHTSIPTNIDGRRLLLFDKAPGVVIDWADPSDEQKTHVLEQAATIRAALFKYNPPSDFINEWFLNRLFAQKPDALPAPAQSSRDFCLGLFTSKLHATIKNLGDMIGWESDGLTVGPVAVAARESLLRLLPHILPQEDPSKPILYRLVLEHGDYGIHNMTITPEKFDVTSVFDWETGCFTPALLSDPLMAIAVDIIASESGDAGPDITRVSSKATDEDKVRYKQWAKIYIDNLYKHAPEYKQVIQAGNDARHLWFALRDWRGDEPEEYFGALGSWAETRIAALGVK